MAASTDNESFNILKWNEKGTFKVVVGIDFGTDGSAVAWGLNDGSGKVNVVQEINDNSKFVDLKTKTNILLNENGEFIAFGSEAREKYIRQFEDDDSDDDDDEQSNKSNRKKSSWLYFDLFKMALYKKAIIKQTKITQGSLDEEKAFSEEYKTDIKSELKAANGKKLPSRTVFIAALKFMKEYAFKMFNKNKVLISNNDEIKWVLTVPAIWSDKSKGLMEQWAIEAGLISNKKALNQLVIGYEPDCASISIQNEIKDYKKLLCKAEKEKNEEKKENSYEKKKKKEYLIAGEKYLLLDLGGGTADIACHEVIDDFSVKEIYQPSGGAWGSTYIDKRFINLFTDLFPKGWITEFRSKRPSDYTILKHNFSRSKETFYARDIKQKKKNIIGIDPSSDEKKKESHNITLPVELIEFLDSKLEEYNIQQRQKNKEIYDNISNFIKSRDFLGTSGKWILNEDKLELDYCVWKHMFDEIIDRIIDHCKNLLSLTPLKNKQCRYICLVGGFSSSRYLQSRIMYELGIKSEYRLIVIIPKRPSLSVVDGAVRLGLKPNYIKSRIIRKTYGIKVNAPISKFNINKLNVELINKNKYFNQRANQQYLHNIFHAYVHKGDKISITDKPKTTKFYASKKNIVGVDVYSSDDKNPIFVSGNPIARKDVLLPNNWDIHNTFPISFFFSDTKIRVFADIDGIEDHEKEIKLDYEF